MDKELHLDTEIHIKKEGLNCEYGHAHLHETQADGSKIYTFEGDNFLYEPYKEFERYVIYKTNGSLPSYFMVAIKDNILGDLAIMRLEGLNPNTCNIFGVTDGNVEITLPDCTCVVVPNAEIIFSIRLTKFTRSNISFAELNAKREEMIGTLAPYDLKSGNQFQTIYKGENKRYLCLFNLAVFAY